MDICQVAFTGDKIVSTFPFLQALATKSFIVYSLHARSPKHLCTRIAKYCNRGFNLLEPLDFDGDFDSLMIQEEIPLHRVEHQQYIDDDGEIQLATKEFHRSFLNNVDTFRLQEKFMYSTMNTNIFSDLLAITADNKATSTGTEREKKRAAPLPLEGQVKKSMANHHSCEERASNVTSKPVEQPKFVSAAEMAAKARTNIQMMPEISDEELLEMAIKFEKEHPQ
ncbi:unnamed protein product [Rotaria sp. Silwood1]|nr:unnamed protein product [Rotaria sp. Silwood1]CAF4829277.1 unnamed protein product [Rotaria sp. Silwood1]